MAVVDTSPLPSPWTWSDQRPFFAEAAGGPVSPTIRGQELDASGSFLQPMLSFRLSGEDESPLQPPPSDAAAMRTPPGAWTSPATSQATSAAWQSPLPFGGPQPLARQPSNAEQLEIEIDEAYVEMDAHLAQQQYQQPQQHHVPPHMAPTLEEQAWLDQEMEMIDVVACTPEQPEDEEEEEYVRRLLQMHPALDEDEARWLFQRERSFGHT